MTEEHSHPNPTPAPARQLPGITFAPTRFDFVVFGVMAALVAGILLTVLLGDHVGVRILRTAPGETAHSTSRITIQFAEPMDRASIEARLRLEDASGSPLDGDYNWNGATLYFNPAQNMHPGQTYTAILEAGGLSQTGRAVLDTRAFSFTIQAPQVAYLYPADAVPQNIWLADPADPEAAEQLTDSVNGIFNFDVSPTGTRIAYAERNPETGGADIIVMDLEAGTLQQVTDCADSSCTTPAWSPDGTMIAYEQVAFNSDMPAVGVSPSRVWLVDLSANPLNSRPLFEESQTLGYGAEWSPDGRRIAVYDSNTRGIMVYDFETEGVSFIPAEQGMVGSFSPDGQMLAYPELIFDPLLNMARSQVQIANLDNNRIISLYEQGEPIDDGTMYWTPDGQHITVSRRYLTDDERATAGRQLYLVNPADGSSEALVFDADYYHSFFEWDPSGDQLVMHRVLQNTERAGDQRIRPEVWAYNTLTGEITQIVSNAYHPRWVP